jgi:hypothetical protein
MTPESPLERLPSVAATLPCGTGREQSGRERRAGHGHGLQRGRGLGHPAAPLVRSRVDIGGIAKNCGNRHRHGGPGSQNEAFHVLFLRCQTAFGEVSRPLAHHISDLAGSVIAGMSHLCAETGKIRKATGDCTRRALVELNEISRIPGAVPPCVASALRPSSRQRQIAR